MPHDEIEKYFCIEKIDTTHHEQMPLSHREEFTSSNSAEVEKRVCELNEARTPEEQHRFQFQRSKPKTRRRVSLDKFSRSADA